MKFFILLFSFCFLTEMARAEGEDSSKATVSDSKVTSSEKNETSLSIQKKPKSITQFQYIAGGVASIIPGFGLGHSLQYRYEERGWIHSLLQGLTVAGIIGIVSMTDNTYLDSIWNETITFKYLVGVLGVLKIVEIVDAWWLPSHYEIQREYIGPPVSISKKRYFAGGFLSLSPIGGVGHAVQGRWQNRGIFFTVMSLMVPVAGMSLQFLSWKSRIDKGKPPFNQLLFWTPYIAVKAWEVLDAWRLPSHYQITENPFQASPVFTYHNQGNYDLGLSLRYNF